MGVQRHIDTQRSFSAEQFYKKWSFVIVEEQWQSIHTSILSKRIKIRRVRADPSDSKRTKG